MADTQGLRLSDALFGCAIMIGMANFVYHAIQGDYGLFSIIATEAEERSLTLELQAAHLERIELENRVARLGERYLDLDLLDETARDTLGLMRSNDVTLR